MSNTIFAEIKPEVNREFAVVFVYQPQSGDRVFAENRPDGRDTPEVVEHPNGCRHVLGGAHLWWEAAEPMGWWRDQARDLARILMRTHGGIAWDDQGTIHVVTCCPLAFADAMDAAAKAFGAPTCAPESLWAGVALGHACLFDGEVEWRRSLLDFPAIEDAAAMAQKLAPRWYPAPEEEPSASPDQYPVGQERSCDTCDLLPADISDGGCGRDAV